MATQLSILNGALALIGEPSVSVVDNTTKAGKTFSALWNDSILVPMVALFPWIAQQKRAALVQPSQSVTAGSVSGTTVTLTLDAWPALGLSVGQSVTVASATPADWNGSWVLTAVDSTAKTAQFTAPITDAYVGSGVLTWSPLFEYSAIYTLPADCARAIKINEIGVSNFYQFTGWQYFSVGDTEPPFKIEGGYLLCDESTVDLLYVSYDNVGFTAPDDPILVKVLTYRTAAMIAFAMTHDGSIKKAAEDDFERVMRESRTSNAMQGTPQDFQESSWIASRS